jgi:hypothetical protein
VDYLTGQVRADQLIELSVKGFGGLCPPNPFGILLNFSRRLRAELVLLHRHYQELYLVAQS